MKGKSTFTSADIKELIELINLRNKVPSSEQKAIRQKMRNIGFYGKDDWGIIDLQVTDLESLIKSDKIKVVGGYIIQPTPLVNFVKSKETKTATKHLVDFTFILDDFKKNRFDPQVNNVLKINNSPGNYILCLRKNSKLPRTFITPTYKSFEGLEVIYTGIASISLRTRDFIQHFTGNNAGRSTLRKSLGVLSGFKQVPRARDPNTGKTKFNPQDEKQLSEWMYSNLIMFTSCTANYNDIEIQLINHFNPPLNLKANKNIENEEFRLMLSNLRRTK